MAKASEYLETEAVDDDALVKTSGATVSSSPPNAVRSAVEAAAVACESPRMVRPPIPFAERLAAVKRAKNPLLEAARVLLRAQADMPDELASKQDIATLRMLLEQEMRTFQDLCVQANIRPDHMIGARYCLCTALDEAAMQTEWGKRGDTGVEWSTNGLTTIFHEDRKGGDKVYLLIGRLLSEPQEHRDLLCVIYRILSFGFEGRYRHEASGKRKHEAIRQRLYNEITANREPAPMTLSPNWQSDVPSKRPSFYEFPVWITVTVLSVILLGMFGWYKYQLLSRAADIRKQIAEIARMVPPPAAPKLHLKPLLRDEIAAGTVSVHEAERRSAVTFLGDAMFQPGGASAKTSMEPLIEKIAGEIARVQGKVIVVGYTDNVPIRGGQFESNQALSKARAMQVMQMLQKAGVSASRLKALGKGDADPVGDNRTAQGRARNRRVEIAVEQ
jgi:type VI secretion system protein ImpK